MGKTLLKGYLDDTVGGVGGPVFDITGNWYQFKNRYISKAGIPSFINEIDHDYNDEKLELYYGDELIISKRGPIFINLFDTEIKYYLDETDVCCPNNSIWI